MKGLKKPSCLQIPPGVVFRRSFIKKEVRFLISIWRDDANIPTSLKIECYWSYRTNFVAGDDAV